MIYRQVIPPAPAYLGLNLFLRGTQVVPKNGGGKKEKSKSDLRPKTERKSSLLTVKTAQNGENDKTPILSPRSLLIDFADCDVLNSATSLTKDRKRICTLTRSNKENVSKNDKVVSGRLHSYLALTRYPSKQNDLKDSLSNRKTVGRIPDPSRRHASCGPKLTSIAPQDENKTEDAEVAENDRSNIKCVGNKFGPEIEITDTTNEPDKSSPGKSSQETPRLTNKRAKLKPINTLSRAAKSMVSNSKERSATTLNEYRKYLAQSSVQLNNKASNISNYNNSHFHAVGLSLRAWRSKYNKIKGNGLSNTATVTNSTRDSSSLKRKNT